MGVDPGLAGMTAFAPHGNIHSFEGNAMAVDTAVSSKGKLVIRNIGLPHQGSL